MAQAARLLILALVFLPACSLLSSRQAAPPPAIPPCETADQGLSPKEREAIAELRRSVEVGPLYAILAGAGIATCNATYSAGIITMDYSFHDRGVLRVKRDSRIDYNDQEARFESPPTQDPKAILRRAEIAAFGASGCGIDWEQPEKQPAEDDPQTSYTIFRGDTCNCSSEVGGRSTRSVRRYSNPTSMNQGTAYSTPRHRSASSAARKKSLPSTRLSGSG